MKPLAILSTVSILLTTLFFSTGLQPALAQEPAGEAVKMNGIDWFAAQVEDPDPLQGNYSLVESNEAVVFFTNRFEGNNESVVKIYDGENGPSADLPLGSLVGEGRAEQLGVSGNEHLAMAAGNFDGDDLDEVVLGFEGTNNTVNLIVRRVISDTLQWSTDDISLQSTESLIATNGEAEMRQMRLVAGNFDGDNHDEFVLAYQNQAGFVQLELFDGNGGFTFQVKGMIADEQLSGSERAGLAKFDLAAGDLDGDGDLELVLVGFQKTSNNSPVFVKVYDVAVSGTLIAKGRTTLALDADETTGIGEVTVATGDFNADEVEEIMAGFYYYFGAASGVTSPAYLYSLQVSPDLTGLTFDANKRETITGISSDNPFWLDLAAGDLNKDRQDELAFAVAQSVRVYESDQNFNLTQKGLFSIGAGEEDYPYSQSFMALKNMNGNLAAELIIAKNTYFLIDAGNDIYRQRIELNAYEASLDPDNNAITGFKAPITLADETVEGQPIDRPHRHFALALGDFDGDTIQVGPPQSYFIEDVLQPLVILNAPPTHFDIFKDDLSTYAGPPYPAEDYVDVHSCYNIPRPFVLSCSFEAKYFKRDTNQTAFTTQVRRDWAVSSGVSVGVIEGIETSIKASYGENFTQSQTDITTITTSEEVLAQTEDRIFATVTEYQVWEYPILTKDANAPQRYLMVIFPVQVTPTWIGIKDTSNAFSYESAHEVGNLLSYPKTITDNLEVSTAFNSQAHTLINDDGPTWTLNTQTFTEETVTTETEVGLTSSLTAGFAGIGLELEGSYNQADLSTHQTSVEQELEIAVKLGGLNFGVGDTRYTMQSYAYWSKNGVLVVDYTVDLPEAALGQDPTWWEQRYGQQPDPAFNLPWRYDPEKGTPLNVPRQRYRNWSIKFTPKNPLVGDPVQISTKIYNYSLKKLSNDITVRFYLGDPAEGGTPIGDVVMTDNIPPRGNKMVTLDWVVPSGADTPRVLDIYAVIDPNKAITEIHENNNKGFNSLVLNCSSCPLPSGGGIYLPFIRKS